MALSRRSPKPLELASHFVVTISREHCIFSFCAIVCGLCMHASNLVHCVSLRRFAQLPVVSALRVLMSTADDPTFPAAPEGAQAVSNPFLSRVRRNASPSTMTDNSTLHTTLAGLRPALRTSDARGSQFQLREWSQASFKRLISRTMLC